MDLKMCSISFTYLHFCLLFQMSCKTQNENKKPEFVNMYLHICLYSKVYSTTATYISEWLFFISKTLMVCFSVTIHFSLDFQFFISQTSKCICIQISTESWKIQASTYLSKMNVCSLRLITTITTSFPWGQPPFIVYLQSLSSQVRMRS